MEWCEKAEVSDAIDALSFSRVAVGMSIRWLDLERRYKTEGTGGSLSFVWRLSSGFGSSGDIGCLIIVEKSSPRSSSAAKAVFFLSRNSFVTNRVFFDTSVVTFTVDALVRVGFFGRESKNLFPLGCSSTYPSSAAVLRTPSEYTDSPLCERAIDGIVCCPREKP